MITEVYLDFVARTRQVESMSYLRTLSSTLSELPGSLILTRTGTAICGSMDSTFKALGKALLTDANQQKSKELRGGILSVINEENEIVAWVSKRLLAINRQHE